MRIRPILVAGALLLGAGATTVAARQIDKRFHESFDVAPGARLRLTHGDGQVTITPWDREVLDVSVRYSADETRLGWSSEVEFDVVFERDGDEIVVKERDRGGITIGFHSVRNHEYVYTIQAPPWVGLVLTGDDGDVRINGWRAAIELTSDDGDIVLSGIESPRTSLVIGDGELRAAGALGELSVRSDDGDATLEDCTIRSGRIRLDDGDLLLRRCSGDVEVRVDDGRVRIEAHGPGALDIGSQDGDVEVQLHAPGNAALTVQADDGSVDVELAAGVSAAFDVRVDDGRIELALPAARDVESSRHTATGVLGGGGGRIRIRVEDGNVSLREAR